MELTAVTGLMAAIPSPSDNAIAIGPLELRAYGLMIALGVIAAVELARRRFAQRGLDPDDMSAIALWAVPAGLVGARLYHVVTDWRSFQGDWGRVFEIWRGGLGIPGGIIAGVAVGIWVGRRRGVPIAPGLDAVAPALPLAQAIGRLGNWFNQELFGEPTTVAWALKIDPENRPVGFTQFTTFHPTFLYEALWNLALVAVLLWLDRRRVLRPGYLIAAYVAGYATGRLWVELLRIDPASLVLGVRVNVWVSVIAIVVSIGIILVAGRRRPGEADPEPDPAEDEDGGLSAVSGIDED